MYPKIIVEHFMNPKNVGIINNASAVGSSNTEGGGKAIFYLLIESGFLKDCKYQVDGCPYAIASASILSESLKGKSITELTNIDVDYFSHFFDLPKEKLNCIKLVVDAFNDALRKFKGI